MEEAEITAPDSKVKVFKLFRLMKNWLSPRRSTFGPKIELKESLREWVKTVSHSLFKTRQIVRQVRATIRPRKRLSSNVGESVRLALFSKGHHALSENKKARGTKGD